VKSIAALPKGRTERVIFFGTPEIAVGPLRALVAAGFVVDLVVTGVDKRRGRGSLTSPSPVKQAAIELQIPVTHDVADAVALVNNNHADDSSDTNRFLGVVVAYGHIISTDALQVLPMINIHYSLLPRWRGAAPVERALLAGDEQTGVCIMQVVEQLDAGDILSSATTQISQTDTTATLRTRLGEIATPLLIDVLSNGATTATPQSGDVVVAAKITQVDLEIDWSKPAVVIDRQVRVGGAFTFFNDKRFKIHSLKVSAEIFISESGNIMVVNDRVLVACGQGVVELVEVQPEGKPRISAQDWKKGARLDAQSRLGL
jgi:methionyl-tRNA formyltransferase